MISLITGLDVADVEQKPSVTASPMVQLALDTTSWCVLQLAPETNDCVICYQLPLLWLSDLPHPGPSSTTPSSLTLHRKMSSSLD